MHTIYDMGNRNRQDAQRMSEQQATIERLRIERDKLRAENELVKDQVLTLASHAARLRSALKARSWGDWIDSNDGCPWCRQMEFDQLGMKVGHRDDCERQAALADPSPAVDAVSGVFKLVDVMMLELWEWAEVRDASIIDMLARPGVDFDKHLEKIADAWDAYRAVTSGEGGAE